MPKQPSPADPVYPLFIAALERAGGIRPLGRKWKLSAAFLCDVKYGRRGYGPQILKRLGFKAVRQAPTTSYIRALVKPKEAQP